MWRKHLAIDILGIGKAGFTAGSGDNGVMVAWRGISVIAKMPQRAQRGPIAKPMNGPNPKNAIPRVA